MRAWLLVAVLAACDETAPPPGVRFDVPADATWATRTEPPPEAVGDLVMITNNFDDTVSYVDLGLVPPREIAKIPVGFNPVEREGPHHLSLSPDHETVWVGISNFVPNSGSGPHGSHGAGTADGHALQIRVSDGVELASVRVDRNPGDIRLTPDGKLLLVSHFDLLRVTDAAPGAPASELDSRLAIVDPATGERKAMVPLCPAAHGIAIAPDSSAAYVACYDDRIAVVDLTNDRYPVHTVKVALGTVSSPECQPYALTIAPDGGTVWVGCFTSGDLLAYDVASEAMQPARTASLGGAALFGAYLSDDLMAVPSQGPDRLHWIDPATGDVVHSLDFDPEDCLLPHVVGPTSDDRLALVCEGDRESPGTLVTIDATRAVQDVVPVGRFPDDIALRPAP